jgi:hypothetical protein
MWGRHAVRTFKLIVLCGGTLAPIGHTGQRHIMISPIPIDIYNSESSTFTTNLNGILNPTQPLFAGIPRGITSIASTRVFESAWLQVFNYVYISSSTPITTIVLTTIPIHHRITEPLPHNNHHRIFDHTQHSTKPSFRSWGSIGICPERGPSLRVLFIILSFLHIPFDRFRLPFILVFILFILIYILTTVATYHSQSYLSHRLRVSCAVILSLFLVTYIYSSIVALFNYNRFVKSCNNIQSYLSHRLRLYLQWCPNVMRFLGNYFRVRTRLGHVTCHPNRVHLFTLANPSVLCHRSEASLFFIVNSIFFTNCFADPAR